MLAIAGSAPKIKVGAKHVPQTSFFYRVSLQQSAAAATQTQSLSQPSVSETQEISLSPASARRESPNAQTPEMTTEGDCHSALTSPSLSQESILQLQAQQEQLRVQQEQMKLQQEQDLSRMLSDAENKFAQELADNVTCIICSDIFANPVTTIPCGHTFCRECLSRFLSDKRDPWCPVCRGALTEILTVNISLTGLIDASVAKLSSSEKIAYEQRRLVGETSTLPCFTKGKVFRNKRTAAQARAAQQQQQRRQQEAQRTFSRMQAEATGSADGLARVHAHRRAHAAMTQAARASVPAASQPQSQPQSQTRGQAAQASTQQEHAQRPVCCFYSMSNFYCVLVSHIISYIQAASDSRPWSGPHHTSGQAATSWSNSAPSQFWPFYPPPRGGYLPGPASQAHTQTLNPTAISDAGLSRIKGMHQEGRSTDELVPLRFTCLVS